MLSTKIEKAINSQINAELYSSYLYVSMGMYFESEDMSGAAKWMNAQAQEELVHAEKFMNYVNERGGRVVLEAIEKPPVEWESGLATFEAALDHERKVSSLINELVFLARSENDYMTDNFLQWFVSEQVEEEASVGEVVRKMRLAGESGGGRFMIDKELGLRVFTPPAVLQE
ncbi:MAG: ferritin [Candidatus Fermentibacteraceae bacterium]|nr:ferritin [Candidatus Fermentibacteraceae bacterium]